MQGAQQIGSIGIANRPGGYDQSVIDLLRPLMSTCGAIFRSLRIERERELANAKLEENEKISSLAARVATTLVTESSLSGMLTTCLKQIQDGLPETFVWTSANPGAGMNQSLTFGDTPHETSIDWLKASEELDRKSTRLNSSHVALSRMPSSA